MPAKKIVAFPQPSTQPSPTPRHKKRADGRYQTKAYYTDPLTGTRKEKVFYGTTFSEADRKKRAFLRELESGVSPDAFSITVAQYVDKWLALRAKKDEGRKTTRTFDTYKREVQRLVDALGAKQLRQVTQSDLYAILLSRQGMSKKAINSTYTALHQVFLSAIGDRLITFDPMAGLQKPEGTSGTHRALEDWEKSLLLTHWQGHRGGLMAIIMLFTGLRRGELCALDWQSVDFSSGQIHVTESLSFLGTSSVRGTTKTDAGVRTIPILPPLLPILQQFAQPSGPVCPGLDGSFMNESACISLWQSFVYYLEATLCGTQKCNVKKSNKKAIREHPEIYSEQNPKYTWKDLNIRMHDLRHTYCTMLYDAGVDPKTAQLLMGHSSIEITLRIYTHLSDSRRLSSLEKLSAFSTTWASVAPTTTSPAPNK